MTYWYTMLSPGGAIIANKYLCLKGVRKKNWIRGRIQVPSTNFLAKKFVDRTWIGPQIFQKKSTTFVWKDEVV